MLRVLLLSVLLVVSISAFTQNAARTIAAERLLSTIKIDGNIDDEAWQNAPGATDFVESEPEFGKKENPDSKTIIKILYDNTSVYIGGYCFEKSKDSIAKELMGRDKLTNINRRGYEFSKNNDFVGIIFDTYNDKINGVGFFITPYGEQTDFKYSGSGYEDKTWNAVWQSETKLHDNGWSFEIKIPYSALRFSKSNPVWGINFTRKRTKSGSQYYWNAVDPKVNGFVNQFGLWSGLKNIQPPTRLSLTPYIATYLNHYPHNNPRLKNTTTSITGGADLKYGISQNFTLDMTLIPDFGQVRSDQLVLNLTPFEIEYDEKRPFFTEGTELFNKGNLFYSRRIGAEPMNRDLVTDSLRDNEIIKDNPSQTKLINALKFSGRTKSGLGIGLFNAVARRMYATIEDTLSAGERKFETSPLSNYNIIVFDQTLKNNSSVSFINTNVTREGAARDANVSSALFDLYDKNNMFNVGGQFALSNLSRNQQNETGYFHHIYAGKVGGVFNFEIGQMLNDNKFNYNDLGLMFNNNQLEHLALVRYRILKPAGFYRNFTFELENVLKHRYTGMHYESNETELKIMSLLKNLWTVGSFLKYEHKGFDFYEPRVPGRYFKPGNVLETDLFFSANQAKRYFVDFSNKLHFGSLFNYRCTYFGLGQRFKVNDKLAFSSNTRYEWQTNAVGFASVIDIDSIILSRRNQTMVENTFGAKYNFNKKMGITADLRHYWTKVKPQQFYLLNQNGSLNANIAYNQNRNININLFNIDIVYSWEFRPGSFLNVVWKNAIANSNNDIRYGYFRNIDHTFNSPQNNNFSIKLLYYLDYLDFKKKG